MGIPLLRGRLPGETDSQQTRPVFVIDESLARRYWSNEEDPLGAEVVWHRSNEKTLTGVVIGIVGSVRGQSLTAEPPAAAYWWWPQIPGSNVTVVARTTAQPRTMAGPMASQITEVDRNQAVGDVRSMQDVVGAELDHPRFTMQLLGGFAGTAALLAAIGLYSVIAVGVTRRTRELGIRIALGAQPQNVLRLAIQCGLVLLGTGLVVGLPVTMVLDRLMAGLLYGITPTDPVTLIAATLLLAVVGMVSTSLPAWRATQIDPVVALQAE